MDAILLRMPTYDYARPAVTVDTAVFRGPSHARELLLVRRGVDPYAGMWALPGGFLELDEPLDHCARRELAEETGLSPAGRFAHVGAYGDPGRDPRGWTVTVLFAVAMGEGEPDAVAGGDDAAEAAWHPVAELPSLAFDHERLVRDAAAWIASH